jgi:transcriptional regulator with XRE-family HTH domain
MSFSEQLKKAMAERNISQAELSVLTGIGKSSISQYLSGKNEPKEPTIRKIEEVLGCSLGLPEKTENECSENIMKFSTKKITIRQAAKVMHISEDTLSEKLQKGELPFGYAHKKPGSSKYSYYISPKKFYEFTGWCY